VSHTVVSEVKHAQRHAREFVGGSAWCAQKVSSCAPSTGGRAPAAPRQHVGAMGVAGEALLRALQSVDAGRPAGESREGDRGGGCLWWGTRCGRRRPALSHTHPFSRNPRTPPFAPRSSPSPAEREEARDGRGARDRRQAVPA
jgi:hypothetical protein